MARIVVLEQRDTGKLLRGYYGFSWITLFFGFTPALCRGDYLTAIAGFTITFLIGAVTDGVGSFVVSLISAFLYNRYYTNRLLARGDELTGARERAAEAKLWLNVAS